MDTETHIYTEGLVETLCGEKNDKKLLSLGYFVAKQDCLFWHNRRGIIQIKDESQQTRAKMNRAFTPMGKLPELDNKYRYIAVPSSKYKTSIMLMCNDCMAIMRLRELE